MSSTPYDIPGLLEKIGIMGKQLYKEDGDARQQCLAAARSLCFALETPVESISRHNWAEVHTSLFAILSFHVRMRNVDIK